jgi:A/G-specific adenine glycosylase
LSRPLLAWYDLSQRDLPWRRTHDPYAIWIAEIMLQQTQVATVVPYYERWLQALPTVEQLAVADPQVVLGLWAGLGYYSRARNLQAAARLIVSDYEGVFPRDYHAARSLPGIGEYTAGAILSIAYGQRLPAVDGNVQRVLGRVFALAGELRQGPGKREVARLAAEAVPAARPGDHNQALMELGATICLPRRPACEQCPLTALCLARRQGRETAIPPPRPQPSRRVQRVAVVLWQRGCLLLARRPAEGVWGGLWELPNVELAAGEDPAAALGEYLQQAFGLRAQVGEPWQEIRHSIMDQRITLSVYQATCRGSKVRLRDHEEGAWVAPADLAGYALPAPHRRIGQLLTPWGQPLS